MSGRDSAESHEMVAMGHLRPALNLSFEAAIILPEGSTVLNYDLVTSKACYRLPRRDDMPILLRLAAQRTAERADAGNAQERMLQTVKELSRHPDRGTIFLFEKGQDLVGYCVLVNHWSNALGGTVIRVDELYLDCDHRDAGIAEDFLELLAKVAPPGTRAIQVEASPKDKPTLRMCQRAGFQAGNARTMTLKTVQNTEQDGT